jgi:hypothetical protein
MKRFAVAWVLAGCLLPAPCAHAGGPAMVIGAAEDSVRQSTLGEAKTQMDLLVRAGFNAVRVTQIWAPGQTRPSGADLRILRNVVEAARLDRMHALADYDPVGHATGQGLRRDGAARVDVADLLSAPGSAPRSRIRRKRNSPRT